MLAADFDGDGIPDTLRLFRSETGPAPAAPAAGMRSVKVRVTIAGGGPRPRSFTVVDETWVVDGRIAVTLAGGPAPPVFAVGVPNSEECYWYRWDGQAYGQVGAVGGSYE